MYLYKSQTVNISDRKNQQTTTVELSNIYTMQVMNAITQVSSPHQRTYNTIRDSNQSKLVSQVMRSHQPFNQLKRVNQSNHSNVLLNLKSKLNCESQTTSTKTRVKGKSNSQNRSQYSTWSTFNQTRRSPQKDQNQIIRQSHHMNKIRQRQAMWSKLDIKNRNSTLKQKWIQWSWKFLCDTNM